MRRDARLFATPLFIVLIVVETTDILFATDSIPAILAITRDPFIVYTSNVFAVLGLRAMYFLLAKLLGMFRYLHVGLAVVLIFVGLKMLVEEPLQTYLKARGIEQEQLIFIALGVIVLILSAAVAASVLVKPKKPLPVPPEQVDVSGPF